jgi:hypothetical protein
MRRSSLPLAAASLVALLAACRGAPPPPAPPAAATTADAALVELSPEAFPAFADDLDYAGLDEALSRSAAHFARIAAADPGRTLAFGKERVPVAKVQATDRAFRIGQQRNVFVHKFVCTGTLEERIQQMLERKREVADSLLAAGENWITELSNDELKRLLTLDRKEALA